MINKQSGRINLTEMTVLELSAALDLVIDSEIHHPETQKEQLMINQDLGAEKSLKKER
jgi:hypothetical protein